FLLSSPPTPSSPFPLPAALPIFLPQSYAYHSLPVGVHRASKRSPSRTGHRSGRIHQVPPSQIVSRPPRTRQVSSRDRRAADDLRSEEHTSELQSLTNLVCRLLLD